MCGLLPFFFSSSYILSDFEIYIHTHFSFFFRELRRFNSYSALAHVLFLLRFLFLLSSFDVKLVRGLSILANCVDPPPYMNCIWFEGIWA